MGDWLCDLRYAARQLRQTPGFAAVAIVTLALGIGATTAFYSLASAVAFTPRSGADLDDVVSVSYQWEPDPNAGLGTLRRPYRSTLLPTAQFRALEAADASSIAFVTGHMTATAIVESSSRSDRLAVELITGQYSDVFRLPLQAGRWISTDDERSGAPPAVVVSDRLSRSWFTGGSALGQTLRVTLDNGSTIAATVVGVAARGFRGIRQGFDATDVWVPYEPMPEPHSTVVGVYIRRRTDTPNVLIDDVRRTIGSTIRLERGTMTDFALAPASDTLTTANLRWLGYAIVGLAALVLLAACANLANMLYARRSARLGEIAVRLSLGARPSRILRLFAAEAILIAVAAAILGLTMALISIRAFGDAFPTLQLDRRTRLVLDLTPDYRVFVAAFAGGALAALTVGVTAAWRSTRTPIQRFLLGHAAAQGATTAHGHLRRSFVAVQITAAVILVMVAGIALQNLHVSAGRELHFDTERVLVAQVQRPYDENVSRTRTFYERLEARLGEIEGVTASALSTALPAPIAGVSPSWSNVHAEPEIGLTGAPRRVDVLWSRVTPGFHDVLGLRITQGRPFRPTDVEGAPLVAIVSASVAASLWPDADPVGRRMVLGTGDPFTVVGVTTDPASSRHDPDGSRWSFASNAVFVPVAQWWRAPSLVLLRSDQPIALIPPLRALVRDLDDTAAVLDAGTAGEVFDAAMGPVHFLSVLTTALGALALGISMLGVYGVIAYLVGLRTREFGIRLALGARPGQIVRMVVDRAVHVVLVGLLVGVLAAALLARLIQYAAFALAPNPLALWIEVPILILALGVVAGLVPALRASRVDPNVALRDL